MFRTILIILILIVVISSIGAKFVQPPPDKDLPASVQNYLRTLQDNINNLEITTTAPNGNRVGKAGDLILYNNAGTLELWANDGTGNKTIWQRIN